jgi:flagellar biogenesis protein FliO
MSTALSPRHRLLLASALILGLAALVSLGDVSAAGLARWLLGAMAIAGLGWWLCRRSGSGPRFTPPERLKVVSRAGLSQRCGLALVEADGRSFLVAFGDSFAEIREAPVSKGLPEQARRSVSRRRAWSQPKGVVQ